MPAKQKHNGQRHRIDKRLQRTTVQLLRPIPGRPQTQLGTLSVRRRATDRFEVLGMPVQRVEVQPNGTVGLRTDAGLVIISAADYRAMLELQVPGGHWPRRMGRLPAPPGTELITTAVAGELLGVRSRTILAWLHAGILQAAGTYENTYGTTCYLLDKAVVTSPATRAALAEQIAAYQKRRDTSGRAVVVETED
jgi:hypothetical protein